MKTIRNVDIEELIEKTIEFLINENLSPLDLNTTARGADNILGKLCSKLFGEYSLKDSMYISTIWKRNQLEFQTQVIQSFKDRLTEKKEPHLEIHLDNNDIKLLENIIVTYSDGRKRFGAEFSNFISKKIQENGIKCWLRSLYNWFRKENGRKHGEYWSGKFSCICCNNKYKMWIEAYQMEKIIVETNSDKSSHSEYIQQPQNRISGEKRKLMAQEISSKGVGNFRAENFLKDQNQFVEYTKIRKISSEFTHRYRLFNEIRVDCDAIKNAFDLLLPKSFKKGIRGFIQDVSINPFKMTLISEIQIQMWDSIQGINPVWYFDASGLFLNEINDQSRPYLFSIVCYDPNSKSLIPISDFFSTANDGLNIQLNLTRIQCVFQSYKKSYNPSVIVTDFSWANIHAILRTFNNCDIIQYLKMCYKKAVSLESSYDQVLKTKLYLCSTHFLKNVIDDFDKNYSKKKLQPIVKTCFIFCFTLLQNSTSISAFNEILLNFYNIFNQPKFNQSLMNSLTKIQFDIKTRNVNWLRSAFQYKDRCYLEKGEDVRKEIVFLNDFSDNYKRDSPFTKYFNDQLDAFKLIIAKDIKRNPKGLPNNKYYNPNLMDIVTKRLHIAPIWSGFIISYELKNFPKRKVLNRFTNNPVEAWFGYFRNKILKINKRLKQVRRLNPSEIVTPYYNYLLMKFKQYFSNTCVDFSKAGFKDSRIDLSEEEKWDFPGFNKSERKKGFYFSNKIDLINEHEIEEPIEKNSCFNELSDLINKNKNDEHHENNSSFDQLNELLAIPSDFEIIGSGHVTDRYICFNFLNANICLKDVMELLNGQMISDLVIELYMNIKSEFKNVKILNYYHSKMLFENTGNFSENFSIYDSIFGLIFIGTIKHWCLFFVDVKRHTFSLLDSLGSSSRENLFFDKWKNFCAKRNEFLSVQWQKRQFQHPTQQDGTSCGVFVCMFFEKLLFIDQNQKKLEVSDQSKFRKKIYDEFVKMAHFQKVDLCYCSICSKTETNKELCISFKCWHTYHLKCLSTICDYCPQCEILKNFNLKK